MPRTCLNFIITLIVLLFSATTAFAAKNAPRAAHINGGNPVAGKDKSMLCQSCHGEDGNSPSTEIPKLAGQYATYIQKQIRDFQSGFRKDPVMSEMAATLPNNQDMLDISAYFASQQPMKASEPVINQAGQDRFMKDGNGCVTCHEFGR